MPNAEVKTRPLFPLFFHNIHCFCRCPEEKHLSNDFRANVTRLVEVAGNIFLNMHFPNRAYINFRDSLIILFGEFLPDAGISYEGLFLPYSKIRWILSEPNNFWLLLLHCFLTKIYRHLISLTITRACNYQGFFRVSKLWRNCEWVPV